MGHRFAARGYAGGLPTEWDASLTFEYPLQLGPVR
jgi:hypothetical protein